jgi:hypothetical protein
MAQAANRILLRQRRRFEDGEPRQHESGAARLARVRILKRNVLTTSFDRQFEAEKNLPLDG